MSQHLVFANCIPLVIKFFNQTILTYVQARNSISALDFPSCVVNEQVELTAETLVSMQQVNLSVPTYMFIDTVFLGLKEIVFVESQTCCQSIQQHSK